MNLTQRDQIVELYLEGKTKYHDKDLKQTVIIPIPEGEITACNSLLIFQYDKLADEFREQIMVQSCIRNLLLEHSIDWTSHIRNISRIMYAQSKTIGYYHIQKQSLLKYPIERGSTIHRAFLECYDIDKERVTRNKLFIDDTIKNSGLQPIADAILNDCGVSIFDYTNAFIKKCKKVKPLKLSRDFNSEECDIIVDEYYKALNNAYLNHIKKFAEKRGIDLTGSIQQKQAQDEVVQKEKRAKIRAEKAAERRKDFEARARIGISNRLSTLNNGLLDYDNYRGMTLNAYERITGILRNFNYKAYMIVAAKGKTVVKFVNADCQLDRFDKVKLFETESDEQLLEFLSKIKEENPNWYISVENLDISCLKHNNASDYDKSMIGESYNEKSVIECKLDAEETYLVKYINSKQDGFDGERVRRLIVKLATQFAQSGVDTLYYAVFYRNRSCHYVKQTDLIRVINNDDEFHNMPTTLLDCAAFASTQQELDIIKDLVENKYCASHYRICKVSRGDINAVDSIINKFEANRNLALFSLATAINNTEYNIKFTSNSKMLIQYFCGNNRSYVFKTGNRWSQITDIIKQSTIIANDSDATKALESTRDRLAFEFKSGCVYEIVSTDDIQSVVPN